MNSVYTDASKILNWYMTQCQNANTTEALQALSYINLQMSSNKCSNILNTLLSYPITATPVSD